MTDINSAKTAAVDQAYNWRVIDADTPRGDRLLLIRRASGVPVFGMHRSGETYFTHWQRPPTFSKEDQS